MEKEIAVKVKENKAVFRWLSFMGGLIFCLIAYNIFQQYNLWRLDKQQVEQQDLLFRAEESLRVLSINFEKQAQLFLKLSEEVGQRVELIERNISKQEKTFVPFVFNEEERQLHKAREALSLGVYELEHRNSKIKGLKYITQALTLLKAASDPDFLELAKQVEVLQNALISLKEIDKVALWQHLDKAVKTIDQRLTARPSLQPEQLALITKTTEALDWRAQLKETLSRISSVIQIREYKSPNHYLSLDAKESLFITTKLNLEQAKIALVSGESSLFKAALNRALEDMQVLGVSDSGLKEVLNTNLETIWPDFSDVLNKMDELFEKKIKVGPPA